MRFFSVLIAIFKINNFLADYDLTDISKNFIERQIDNYVGLVTHGHRANQKEKRSLQGEFTQDSKGKYLFEPVQIPYTVFIFKKYVNFDVNHFVISYLLKFPESLKLT